MKKNILNEIFNLRIPEGSNGNEYLNTQLKTVTKTPVKELDKKTKGGGKVLTQKGGASTTFSQTIKTMVSGISFDDTINIQFPNGLEQTIPSDAMVILINGLPITGANVGERGFQDLLIGQLKDIFNQLNGRIIAKVTEESGKFTMKDGWERFFFPMMDNIIQNTHKQIDKLKPKKGIGPLAQACITLILGNGQRRNQERIPLSQTIISIISNLFNEYKNKIVSGVTNTKATVLRTSTKEDGTSSSSGALSKTSQLRVNTILKKICENINNNIIKPIPSSLGSPSQLDTSITDGNIFQTERYIIDGVANGGSTSGIDEKLYNSFLNWIPKVTEAGKTYTDPDGTSYNQIGQIEKYTPTTWSVDNLKKFITPTTDRSQFKTIFVVNNALTAEIGGTKMIKSLSLSETNGTNNFKIICPLSSIYDAQGSFGSCNFGLDKERKNSAGVKLNKDNADIIKSPMDLQIEGPAESGFLITFTLNITPPTVGTRSGKAVLEYTITPGYGYMDSNGLLVTFTGRIETVIKDKALDILSARTVFSDVFSKITANINNAALDSYLDNQTVMNKVMESFLQKFFGDFGQELNVIVEKNGDPDGPTAGKTLLANGDRPSFIRATLLYLLAMNDINDQSYLWFMTPRGGLSIKKPPPPPRTGLGGGTIKKKTKKRNNKKKRKNRKTNKKKSKTRKNKTRKNKRKTKKSKKTIKKR